jgi:hypothetical protein
MQRQNEDNRANFVFLKNDSVILKEENKVRTRDKCEKAHCPIEKNE